jgi:23S rRNA (uracil1939-C5)-methyltransferase
MSATPATTPRPERGQELELTIDTLAHGGNGVARLEGYVVFVSGALPGDRVRAVVTKRKRAYAEARTVEILAPSPDRIEPVAPGHPGASWQVLSYERQLAIKAEQVEDALRRIGKLDGFAMEPMVPAEEHWRYRNKLEYSFGRGPDAKFVCGFHKPGSWEEVVGVEDDMLASAAVNAARERVVAGRRALRRTTAATQKGFLRNLVIREAGARATCRSPGHGERPRSLDGDVEAAARRRAVLDADPACGETTAGRRDRHLTGAPQCARARRPRVRGSRPRRSSRRTRDGRAALRGRVEYADLKGYERVYDLFCGMGTIGLSLAPKAGEVWGLEIVEEAIGDAIANAKRNDLANTHFFAGDVRLALRELVERAGRPDLVVVDPPRSGLSQKVVRRIIETAPKRIVYVSCNPTTLAPNAAQLVEAGYALTRVRPVDMFPQTPHIECVALLERAEAPA